MSLWVVRPLVEGAALQITPALARVALVIALPAEMLPQRNALTTVVYSMDTLPVLVLAAALTAPLGIVVAVRVEMRNARIISALVSLESTNTLANRTSFVTQIHQLISHIIPAMGRPTAFLDEKG